MRIALIILIGIHGIIHLFGFLKAFGISEFNAINQPISKTSGLFWLVTFLLFSTALILLLIRSDYWWFCGWPALITSQILIFNYWSDTKYGTIANLIILLASILAYSNYHFNHQIKKERTELSGKSEESEETIVNEDDITLVP